MKKIDVYFDLKNETIYLRDRQEQSYNFLHDDEQKQLPVQIMTAYETLQKSCLEKSPASARKDLRTMLVSICRAQKISSQNLKLKIKALQKKGYISSLAAFLLNTFFEKGKRNAGKTKAFSSEQLRLCLEVINHILRIMIYLRPVQ